MKTLINGRLILPDENGDFKVFSGKAINFDEKIISIGEPAESAELIDAENNFIAPGFINIHIHGAAGVDTMDEMQCEMRNAQCVMHPLQKLAEFLPTCGVTSFLPTTMTMPLDKIYRALERIRVGKNFSHGARILGAHVEGPFISRKFKGAQAEENILPADFELIKNFVDVIKIITVAPEELGNKEQDCKIARLKDCKYSQSGNLAISQSNHCSLEFIDRCRAAGIIVSIGHSAATYELAMAAIAHGANHITHLFNAQTGFHHRKPGIVGAALDSNATVELITDNVHVCPAAQRLVAKVKPRSEIILITDSIKACGIGDGVSELGGQKVFVNGNLATLEDGTIAGSVAKMNEVLRIFCENTGFDIAASVELVTKNPAVELNVFDRLGSLEVGKAADITIFDDNFNIRKTFVLGTRY